ncbi:MAG: hypothetical protein WC554_14805 [Clostridia bacterium]|jgi:hypothetical protein
MTLKDLRKWIDSVPIEFDEYKVVNAEFGGLGEEYSYRLDKPVTTLDVNTGTKEILIMNEKQ